MDPDVRIGRSLPSGKLLVTCQIGAGETASMFWCRCSLRYTIWGGFGRRVVYYQVSVPGVWSCLMEIGLAALSCQIDDSVVTASLYGWVGSM